MSASTTHPTGAAKTTAASVEARPLPRADGGTDGGAATAAQGGLFPFATTSLRGLPFGFWALQVYLFLSLTTIDEHWMGLGAFHPRLLLGLLTLLIAASRMIAGRTPTPPALHSRQTRWLFLFVAAGVLSVLWAYDFGRAVDSFISHATNMLSFGLIVMLVRTRREFLLTVLTMCFGLGVFLGLSFWEWHGGRMQFTMGVVRMIGAGESYADPNSFGATIVFALPMMLWVLVFTSRIWLRLGALVFGVATLVAVFYTSSRSALVLTALTGVWAVFFMPAGRLRTLLLVSVLGLGALMAAQLSPAQVKRIGSIFSSDTYQREESASSRLVGYQIAWQIFEDHPVTGIGPGNWSDYRRKRVDGDPLMPHNMSGQLIATRGLVGTIAFLGFLLSSIAFGWRQWRSRRTRPGAWDQAVARWMSAMLFTYVLLLVSGLFAHNLARPNWYWCSALMLVAATCSAGAGTRRPQDGALTA